jgi:cytochrome P450
MINAKIDQRLVRQTTPGPRSYPWVGFIPQVISYPLKTLTSAAFWGGGAVCLGSYLPGRRVILITRPRPLKHMLLDRASSYTLANAFVAKRVSRMFGKGVSFLTGESWLQRRRLLQPAFHRDRYARYESAIINKTAAAIECWRSPAERGESLDILDEMSKITRNIVTKIMFGVDLSEGSEETRELIKAIRFTDVSSSLLNLIDLAPLWTPTTRNRTFKHALTTFNRFADRLIGERRRNGGDQRDMLSMLMEARDQDTGATMNDDELRDEVRTQFIGGFKTTAITLAWTWYLLSKHPEIERRFHAEVDDVIGGRLPALDDLHRLVYTRMIVSESIRLYPAVWLSPRALPPNETDEIEGHPIDGKTLLFFSPYVTHRLPDLWEDPEVFDPERFRPERIAKRPQFSYIGFSGRPRQCIGSSLAMMEIPLILATVAQRYSLQTALGASIEPKPATLLSPRNGVPMTVHPRY